jgi:hypothetical protein
VFKKWLSEIRDKAMEVYREGCNFGSNDQNKDSVVFTNDHGFGGNLSIGLQNIQQMSKKFVLTSKPGIISEVKK